MSGNQYAIRMRRSDGSVDSVVYFSDGTTATPDADGTVRVPSEDIEAMLLAGYEMIDQADLADFERW